MPTFLNRLALLCLLLLAGCGSMNRQSGPITYLRAAVELDGGPVLQILQQHLSQSSYRFGVLVDVQRDEQDQFLLDHFVQ